MGKAKTLPASAFQENPNYKAFQEIVKEELKKIIVDEEWAILKSDKFVKHILEIKNENLKKFINKSWEIKDLAISNGCPDVFGCQIFEGKTKTLFNFIVFDL